MEVTSEELTDVLRIIRSQNIEGLQTDKELEDFLRNSVNKNNVEVVQSFVDVEQKRKDLYEKLTVFRLEEILRIIKDKEIEFLKTDEERLLFMENIIKNNKIKLIKYLIEHPHEYFDLKKAAKYSFIYKRQIIKDMLIEAGYIDKDMIERMELIKKLN